MKKFLVLADIEGVTGVTTFKQAEGSDLGKGMLAHDLNAVLSGIRKAGGEAVIYDMHTDGRNVDLNLVHAPVIMGKPIDGEKYKAIAEAMGVDTTGMDQAAYRKAAVDAVRQLSVDVGIPTKLAAMKEADIQFLAESAFADACAPGNPREASVEDLKGLIRQLM